MKIDQRFWVVRDINNGMILKEVGTYPNYRPALYPTITSAQRAISVRCKGNAVHYEVVEVKITEVTA